MQTGRGRTQSDRFASRLQGSRLRFAASRCPLWSIARRLFSHSQRQQQQRRRVRGNDQARLAVFGVALNSFAQKGPPQISPGQRPGWRLRNLRRSPERATHRRSAVAPLQGFFPRFPRFFASTGRCPGLLCPAPSGPKPQTAQHQNLRFASILHIAARSRHERVWRDEKPGAAGSVLVLLRQLRLPSSVLAAVRCQGIALCSHPGPRIILRETRRRLGVRRISGGPVPPLLSL
jgi:hypothetical protein